MIQSNEKKAFSHKLRGGGREGCRPERRRRSSTSLGRGGDRESDTDHGEEGIHTQAQVEEETGRVIQTKEKKAFIHQLIF